MMTKHKSPNKSSDDNQEMEVEGGIKQITKKRRDIDIEKANQLMKKSKNHSNKEAAKSADKEVIVVNEKEVMMMMMMMMMRDKFVYGTKVNKFNQIILTSIEEFKEIRKNRASTGSLSQKELIDYVDEEFVQKILSRQLVAVNISELTRNGGFDILVDFVRETFKVSWNGKNLSAVKELDNITKELTIPSRSGNKIVDSLSDEL
ncbi:hypothetical protein GLOIN_2v1876551 [Rhizophagus irregularis DAOM 181602=DAOM 197198]|nr:hypothetical protein GLOIN_2v1876551 [Rhizophagus irregularis DAOM 181602=DAOM 197198]